MILRYVPIISLGGLIFCLTIAASSASVRVFSAPQLRVESTHRFLVRGRPLALSCRSDQAELTNVRWFRDGVPLDEHLVAAGTVWSLTNDGGLTLRAGGADQVQRQQGSYWCAANVSIQIDERPVAASLLSASVTLVVADTGPFERTGQQVITVEAVQGEVARLPCPGMPANTPSPARMWFEKLPPQHRHRMWRRRRLLRRWKRQAYPGEEGAAVIIDKYSGERFLLSGAALQIGVVQPTDAGRYRCVLANAVTNRTRRSRTLVQLNVAASRAGETTPPGPLVLPPGALKYPPVDQPNALVLAAPGNSVLLECLATMGRIRWNRITSDGRREPIIDGPKTRQIWGNLNISNVTPADGGQYECQVLPLVASGMASSRPSYQVETGRYTVLVIEPTSSVFHVVDTTDGGLHIECGLEGGLSLGGNLGRQPELFFDADPMLRRADLDALQTDVEKADLNFNPISVTLAAPAASPGRPGRFGAMVQCAAHSAINLTNLTNLVHMDSEKLERGHVSTVYVLLETPPLPIVFGSDKFGMAGRNSDIIFSRPYNVSRPLGSTVQLVCMADAGANVHWTNQWGGPVRADGVKFSMLGTGTLEIRRVGYDDQGWYQCNAQSLDGRTERAAAFLRVTDYDASPDAPPPQAAFDMFEMAAASRTTTSTPESTASTSSVFPSVSQLAVIDAPRVELNGTSVVLQWDLPRSVRASKVRWTQVQMRAYNGSMRAEQGWNALGDSVLPPATRRTKLVNLESGDTYQFRILANLTAPAALVASEASLPVSVKGANLPVQLQQPPNLLRVKAVSRDALHVQWTHVAESGARVQGFLVQYRINDRNYGVFSNSTVLGPNAREHIVDHLLPATEYQVLVRAFNGVGQSLPSNSIFAATQGGGLIVPSTGAAPTEKTPDEQLGGAAFMSNLSRWLSDADRFMYALLLVALIVVTTMLCCLICCVLAHRKRSRMHKAARGKYVDASRRIHREQSGNLSNNNNPAAIPSLYQQSMDSTNAADTTKPVIPMDEMMPMLGGKEGSRIGTLNRGGGQYGRCTPLLATPADDCPSLGRRASGLHSQPNDYDMQIPGRTFYGYDESAALATSTPQDRPGDVSGPYAGYILSTTAMTNVGHLSSPVNTLNNSSGGRPRSPMPVPTPTVSVNGALPNASGAWGHAGAALGPCHGASVSAASPHSSNSSSGIGGTADASLATPTRNNERGNTPSMSTFRPDADGRPGTGSLRRTGTRSPPVELQHCGPLNEDDELPPPPLLLTQSSGVDCWRHSSTPSTTCLPAPLNTSLEEQDDRPHRNGTAQTADHVHNLSD